MTQAACQGIGNHSSGLNHMLRLNVKFPPLFVYLSLDLHWVASKLRVWTCGEGKEEGRKEFMKRKNDGVEKESK